MLDSAFARCPLLENILVVILRKTRLPTCIALGAGLLKFPQVALKITGVHFPSAVSTAFSHSVSHSAPLAVPLLTEMLSGERRILQTRDVTTNILAELLAIALQQDEKEGV